MSKFILERPSQEDVPVNNQVIGKSGDKLYLVKWANSSTPQPIGVAKFWQRIDDGEYTIINKKERTFTSKFPEIDWEMF